MRWTSSTGVVLRDLVPAALRRSWVAAGYCPDRDLYSLFRERVAEHPGRTAVIDDAGAMDYASLDRAVRRLARLLRGYGPTDIIGIDLANSRDGVVAEMAVAAVGAVAVHVPGGGSSVGSSVGGSSVVSTVITDVSPAFESGWDAPWSPVAVDPEAPARILVSSGTEAAPKLVAYSHNAFAGGRGNYVRAVHGATAVPRDLVLVPSASAFGSFGAAITLCRFGGTVVLMRRFDAAAALRAVEEHRPTHVFGVPTMLRRMAVLASGGSAVDTSSVRAFVSSGDVLTPETLALVRGAFGRPVINIYGSSDGVNCHTSTPEHGVGRPDPAVTDIRVVDGEICARGPMTPLCYVGAPELDRRHRLPGGWVRTGDEGYFDADGTLHVVRRLKRVVIRGGYTISPAEVEQALGTHPGVAEVACVPVPDRELGERLCACVAVRPGHRPPSLGQLAAFLTERGLSRRKLPEHLVVLPELPLGRTGKVCLNTVTRLAAEHHGGVV